MKALSCFGGLYTDLDVFGLGFAWGELVPEGILLCKEPDSKTGLLQREYECVSLAMIGLPAGCKILEDCLALIMEKWTRHTTAVLAGDKQRVDWSKRHRDWMFNTKTFSLALQKDSRLRSRIQKHAFAMPLAAHEEEFPKTGSQKGVRLEKLAKLLNVWERQWPSELVKEATAWALERYSQRSAIADNKQALRHFLDQAFPALIQWLGEPSAWRVFAVVLSLAASDAGLHVLKGQLGDAPLAAAMLVFALSWEGLDELVSSKGLDEVSCAATCAEEVPWRRRAPCRPHSPSVSRARIADLCNVNESVVATCLAQLVQAVGHHGAGIL